MDVVKIRSDSNISSSTAGTSRSNVNFEQTSSFIGSGVGLYSNFPSTSTSFIAPDAGSLDGDFDGPRYQYDLDFDLEALKRVLSTDHNLDESGYQSVLARSQTSRYGTGWLMCDTESLASNCSADEWDGYMSVGGEKVKIKDMSDLLAARYAFLSGAKTADGLPILTFPDIRVHLQFPDYRRLITYLLQVPPLEDTYNGNVVVIDRRLDKWTTVKTLLVHISNFFPSKLQVVYLLKPEGVLQRALERGYKSILDSCRFRIILCHTIHDLHSYVAPKYLTLDLGGTVKYNHLEWVQHRMDIERMRSSTQVIAQSLEEFSACLKDTELPNDAETTQTIIDTQKSERESIKEDFHIAVRRGFALLKNVRQAEVKPNSDQLSPTRLQNVTTIERMLIQLDETEKSFDKFWLQHEHRLQKCLQLRRFEDDFRKLQCNFAQHMLHLEEHREVGDTVDKVDTLISLHKSYMEKAEDDVSAAETLKRRGEELILIQEKELEGSLKPKCDELQRMKDALHGALQRRLDVLRLSKQMHEQISVANAWCSKGVELLTNIPMDLNSKEEGNDVLKRLEDFLAVGNSLQLDSLRLNRGTELKSLVLMTTTDTSALLQQVSARIYDIKKMCESRKNFLAKSKDKSKPIGAVSPQSNETVQKPIVAKVLPAKAASESFAVGERKLSLPVFPNVAASFNVDPNIPSPSFSSASSAIKAAYVIDELLTTEQVYVNELNSLIEFYVKAFERPTLQSSIPPSLVGQQNVLFGNLVDLWQFHSQQFLKDLMSAKQHPRQIARCFLERRAHFYLYNIYCQNKPRSESLRSDIGECHPFFQECQRMAGHRLPLGAYLLKPVQRITKYQLLLKELAKHCHDMDCKSEIDQSVDCMLDLLQQLNASMHQTYISGYPGDLTSLGQVLLQGKYCVWHSRKHADKSLRLRRTGKAQQRHLFLYTKAIIVCKHRRQSPPYVQEYYEFKLELPIQNVGLTEHVKGNPLKFELWTDARQDVYTLQPTDYTVRNEWVTKVKNLIVDNFYSTKEASARVRVERPNSWTSQTSQTSQTSSESSRSSRDMSSNPDIVERLSPGDSNNNPPRPHSLPETATFEECLNGEFSDAENNTLVPSSESFIRVAHDFVASGQGELSVNCGENVTVLTKSDAKDWALVQKSNSTLRGWVPLQYLEIL